jgi:hypothetical protein
MVSKPTESADFVHVWLILLVGSAWWLEKFELIAWLDQYQIWAFGLSSNNINYELVGSARFQQIKLRPLWLGSARPNIVGSTIPDSWGPWIHLGHKAWLLRYTIKGLLGNQVLVTTLRTIINVYYEVLVTLYISYFWMEISIIYHYLCNIVTSTNESFRNLNQNEIQTQNIHFESIFPIMA